MAFRVRGVVRPVHPITLLLLCLLAPTAGAFTLRYDAPAGCPSAAFLRAAVVEGLGTAPGEGLETVAVVVAADRRSAEVGLLDPSGVRLGGRELRSEQGDCEALVRAAGLSAGLALAPLRVSPPPPRPDDTAPADDGVALHGAWAAGLATAIHPGFALALDGGVHLEADHWSGGVELWLTGAPAWFDGEVGGGRIRSGALGGGLWGCVGGGGVTGCLGGLLGVEGHAGVDFSEGAGSVGPWLAAGMRAEWRFVGSWGARATVLLPISRLTLTVDDLAVWTTPAVGAIFGLGGRL